MGQEGARCRPLKTKTALYLFLSIFSTMNHFKASFRAHMHFLAHSARLKTHIKTQFEWCMQCKRGSSRHSLSWLTLLCTMRLIMHIDAAGSAISPASSRMTGTDWGPKQKVSFVALHTLSTRGQRALTCVWLQLPWRCSVTNAAPLSGITHRKSCIVCRANITNVVNIHWKC